MTRLVVRGFATGYGAVAAIHGVDMTVPAGAIHTVLGPHGAGKTALLQGVVGLLPAASGEVYLDGAAITTMPAWRRARLGMRFAPQGARLFVRLSVAEHLRLAAHRDRAAITGVLDRLPTLANRLRHCPDQLSGGEAALLSLARALLGRPRMLVLDDPTDGLAPAVVAAVHELIADAATADAAVLISAGRAADVHPNTDQITHLAPASHSRKSPDAH